jgi:hypothetical protein
MNPMITPLRIKGLVAPVMRPLPTLFNHARLTADGAETPAEALEEAFQANLTALAEILEKIGQDAGLPSASSRPVLDACFDLASLRGEDLAAGLDRFCAQLTALHEAEGKAMRKAVIDGGPAYRDLYRRLVGPKNVLVCCEEGEGSVPESLERKLTERCYYDCSTVVGDWTAAPGSSADVVLFAPSRRPLAKSSLTVAESNGLPFLILTGGNKTEDMQNMALMKAEHHYRQSGYNVLRSPFNPPRLYSAIDGILMRHLAGKVTQLPRVEAAAAVRRAFAGQG